MTVTPFAPGSFAARRSADMFVSMRRELDDLQRQLATGKRADSFAGLGLERRTSLDFRAKLSAIAGYQDAISDASFRVTVTTQVMQRLDKIGRDTMADILPSRFDVGADGRTTAQTVGEQRLREVIDVLNQHINGQYLFSGRSVDKKPVESYDRLTNGDSGAGVAGLKQIIAERKAADRGDGYGRTNLVNDGPGNSIELRTTDALPFGVKLVSLVGPLTGATFAATGVAGDTGVEIDFAAAGQPAAGETVKLVLRLPDGSDRSFTFTAQASGQPAIENGFVIDAADEAVTRTNLFTAMRAAIGKMVDTDLAVVSTTKAAEDFFFAPPATGPTRVLGAPASAVATAVGTAANTILWYQGEADTAVDARDTALVRIDATQVVGTGARANEPAIRSMLAQLGVLATESFTNTQAEHQRYDKLTDQIRTRLSPPYGTPRIEEILVEFSSAIAAMNGAKERHEVTKAMLNDTLGQVENASTEEVASSILALQTRLQASYQTTSIMSRLSLVNFL